MLQIGMLRSRLDWLLQSFTQGPVSYAGGGILKDVKNKAVLCKPLTMTKATYCKPHMQSKPLQTGEHLLFCDRKTALKRWRFMCFCLCFPSDDAGVEGLGKEYVPVPIYVPVPMNLYAQVTPTPIAIPIPVRAPSQNQSVCNCIMFWYMYI